MLYNANAYRKHFTARACQEQLEECLQRSGEVTLLACSISGGQLKGMPGDTGGDTGRPHAAEKPMQEKWCAHVKQRQRNALNALKRLQVGVADMKTDLLQGTGARVDPAQSAGSWESVCHHCTPQLSTGHSSTVPDGWSDLDSISMYSQLSWRHNAMGSLLWGCIEELSSSIMIRTFSNFNRQLSLLKAGAPAGWAAVAQAVPHSLHVRCASPVRPLQPLAALDEASLAQRGWACRAVQDVPPAMLSSSRHTRRGLPVSLNLGTRLHLPHIR